MDVEPADSSGGGTPPRNRRAAGRTALRRARGALLRLAFDRRVAVGVGVVLLAPAALLRRADYGWESWLTDGLGLLCGATGVAFVAFALSGRRPDWIDPDG
ncbi:MAG: hypothetical protein OXH69_16295 [Acidobacteria bacterium]|nr:hypothetical protein [Acidobacteriota bacterium]